MNARTSTPRGSSMLMNRAMAKRLKDQPANATTDSLPSYIDVTSNLAEDTVIAGVMDIAPGDSKVAMFANPFAGGSEEMLYIDEQNTLRWARHVNPVAGEDPGGLSGWSIDPVATDTLEVVVVVHPDGSVCAFTITSPSPVSNIINLFTLAADPAVPGGVRWSKADFPHLEFGDVPKSFLQVTYSNDRPATPVVFVDSTAVGALWWVMPNYPMPPSSGLPSSTWLVDSMRYDQQDKTASAKVAGIDSTNLEFSQEPRVSNVTLWSLVGEDKYVTTYDPRSKQMERELVGTNVERFVGPWTSPNHAGLVWVSKPFASKPRQLVATSRLDGGTGYPSGTITLDTELEDLAVWQDAGGLLHIYARDEDATLRVIHQTGWMTDYVSLPGGAFVPVFETLGEVNLTGYEAVARPLIASVATFALDAYPDDMPNQHVMHQGVPPGETCALYAQNEQTSFWSEERMRLVPEALPKPYLVPRYETTLTVKNSYGAAVGNCEIHLTADTPVDLEIDGRFYRTGTSVPTILQTDLRGQVTLRVVARSLNVPHLTVTVPGMSQALTVQMAADVHRFLAGTDTLPNHQDGFTPQVVQNATVPGGTTPLFPNLAKAEVGDATWPPTAAELVTWCQGAFAVEAGTPLPAAMFDGLAEDEEVCGFTIQARDPSQRGFEVFTSADQLRAHREMLREQGVVDELSTWFGDVWQAISDGVIDIAQATINLVDQTVELVIYLADEVAALFVCAWDDIVSAAHVVEAAFVALGAEIEKVIDWLKWLFNFADAFKVAKQLYGVIDSVPDIVKDTVKILVTEVDDFFISKEEEVRAWFGSVKEALGDRSIGSLQGATGGVPADGQPSAQTNTATDQVQGPHASWFTDKMFGTPAATGTATLPAALDTSLGDTFADFLAVFENSSNLTELTDALSDLGDLFWNLFSGKDAESVLATELATLLDLVENVIIWVLKTLDDVVDGALEWATKAIDLVADMAKTSLEDVPLLSWLWDFMLEQAGLSKDDYPFTVGMVAAFFMAYPFTVIMKLVTDKEPFPEGIPLPPRTGSLEVGGEVPFGDAILLFQAFQGIMQTADAYLDLVLNNGVLSGGTWKASGLLLQVFSFGHFWAYVVGDHPWMWGYPYPPGKTHWVLPYIRYAPTCLLNMIDLVCAFKFETIAEIFEALETDPDKAKKDGVFAAFVFLCGWERIGVNLAEFDYLSDPSTGEDFDPAAPNWYDWWNLWINITAYIQTATGFIRYFAQHPFEFEPLEEIIYAALGVKNVVDVVGDVFSGVCTVIQPMREVGAPTAIQGKPAEGGKLEFEDAVLFAPYESTTVVQVKGGWPYYSWDAVDPDDPSQGNWLPPGLRLERLELTKGWVGDAVRIVGVPIDYGTKNFTLTVSDNYGPSSTDSVPGLITAINPGNPGPAVSFTCSVISGVFPLQVTFTNTTTDPFTEVHWDFGDGQTSSDANPTITYQWSGQFTAILACKGSDADGDTWGAASQIITVRVS